MKPPIAPVEVGASPLTLETYQAVVIGRAHVRLSDTARSRMASFRASLMRQLERGARIYGVNTVFLCTLRIASGGRVRALSAP